MFIREQPILLLGFGCVLYQDEQSYFLESIDHQSSRRDHPWASKKVDGDPQFIMLFGLRHFYNFVYLLGLSTLVMLADLVEGLGECRRPISSSGVSVMRSLLRQPRKSRPWEMAVFHGLQFWWGSVFMNFAANFRLWSNGAAHLPCRDRWSSRPRCLIWLSSGCELHHHDWLHQPQRHGLACWSAVRPQHYSVTRMTFIFCGFDHTGGSLI